MLQPGEPWAGVVYRGWVRHIECGRARVAMVASYQAVTDDVKKLGDDELARPSGCRGWSRGDLLFHLLLDAQRALVTFATPASGEADVGWGDVDYVLKATGRAKLTAGDRAGLGVLAARFPLLG